MQISFTAACCHCAINASWLFIFHNPLFGYCCFTACCIVVMLLPTLLQLIDGCCWRLASDLNLPIISCLHQPNADAPHCSCCHHLCWVLVDVAYFYSASRPMHKSQQQLARQFQQQNQWVLPWRSNSLANHWLYQQEVQHPHQQLAPWLERWFQQQAQLHCQATTTPIVPQECLQ